MKKSLLVSILVVGATLPALAGESSWIMPAQNVSSPEAQATPAATVTTQEPRTNASPSVRNTTAPVTEDYASLQGGSVQSLVTKMAQAHGVDPRIVHGIVRVESRYRCNAVNGPYRGLMQVHSRTARGVGISGNLLDCRTNLEAGIRYLKESITKYGSGCAGVSGFNSGHYKTGRCTAYGRKVLALAGSVAVASAE